MGFSRSQSNPPAFLWGIPPVLWGCQHRTVARAVPGHERLLINWKDPHEFYWIRVVDVIVTIKKPAFGDLGLELPMKSISNYPKCEPCCWYIYLHNWVIFGVDVGKYSSTMEHLGMLKPNVHEYIPAYQPQLTSCRSLHLVRSFFWPNLEPENLTPGTSEKPWRWLS